MAKKKTVSKQKTPAEKVMMTTCSFRVTFTGRVSGSMAGRDDGQPEEQSVDANQLEELLDYVDEDDAKFYSVSMTEIDQTQGKIAARKRANALEEAKKLLTPEQIAAIKAS